MDFYLFGPRFAEPAWYEWAIRGALLVIAIIGTWLAARSLRTHQRNARINQENQSHAQWEPRQLAMHKVYDYLEYYENLLSMDDKDLAMPGSWRKLVTLQKKFASIAANAPPYSQEYVRFSIDYALFDSFHEEFEARRKILMDTMRSTSGDHLERVKGTFERVRTEILILLQEIERAAHQYFDDEIRGKAPAIHLTQYLQQRADELHARMSPAPAHSATP